MLGWNNASEVCSIYDTIAYIHRFPLHTGQQTPILTCERVNGGTVDDFNCNLDDKPPESSQPCNTHACPPR